MNHSFDIELACEFSIEEAILIHNFAYWIDKNRKNEINYYDGRFWSYDSVRALTEQFPYMTQKKLYRVINGLCDKGILMKGNYNKKAYDRTSWYAFTDLGDSICEKYRLHIPKNGKCISQNGKMDLPEWENGFARMGTPIPDTTTNTTTDIIREEGEMNFTTTTNRHSENPYDGGTSSQLPVQEIEIISNNTHECTSIVPKEKGKGVARARNRSLEEREQDFYNTLIPYVAEYGNDMIRAFYNYWSEPNQQRTKMKFEMQKTWSVKCRLSNWSNREQKYNNHGAKNQRSDENKRQIAKAFYNAANGIPSDDEQYWRDNEFII